jgi:dCTP deaminase
MILSGNEIDARIGQEIEISPYDRSRLNPNSYNLSLHNELLVYEEVILDVKHPNRFRRLTIPDEGLILNPNQIYLGRTVEYTRTDNHVPMIEGRSSLGRLGLFVHATCGFGNVGFCGYWTLEMYAVQPVRIYPYIPICQIFYHEVAGEVFHYSSDKYQDSRDIKPSLFYREFSMHRDANDEAELEQYLYPTAKQS